MLKEVEKASEALDFNSESILLQPMIFVTENPDDSFEKGIEFNDMFQRFKSVDN
jgi:hypothetical protein